MTTRQGRARSRNIALLIAGGLGDHIVLSPTLKGIRDQEPEARITLLCTPWLVDLYVANPYVNHVVAAPHASQYVARGAVVLDRLDASLGALRLERFDYLYNAYHHRDSEHFGILASRLHAQRKIAYRGTRELDGPFGVERIYDTLLERPVLRRCRDYQRAFFRVQYGVEMDPLEQHAFYRAQDQIAVDEWFGWARPPTNLVIVHGAGSVRARRLAPEQLNSLCTGLRQHGFLPVVVGTNNSELILRNGIDASNALSITQTLYLVEHSVAVIGPDSGVKHLGSVARRPILELAHIPEHLLHLNGPFVEAPYRYSGLDYWAPHPDCPYAIVYPEDPSLSAQDIESGRSLGSLSMERALEALERIAPAPTMQATALVEQDKLVERLRVRALRPTPDAPKRATVPGLPDDFDAQRYLALHPDVRAAGMDPVVHYLNFGRSEGRRYL